MFDVALIDTCKNYNVPTIIVKAIIKNESAKNPLALNVNDKGKSLISYSPKTKEEAYIIATSWMAKGYTVDIGLMQFNSANFKHFSNYDVYDMLDPCKNIEVTSTIYYKNYISLNKNYTEAERVLKALSLYNTGSTTRGFRNGYVAKYKGDLSTYLGTNDFGIKKTNNKINKKKKKKRTNKDSYKYASFLLRVKAPSDLVYD